MTDEQNILLSLVKLMFPREMLDYFEVVGFEIHEDSINVRLDERDRIHKKRSGHTYVKNGFLPESLITDFPIRDKRATLIVRRRRWKDEETGEIVSNDYELVAKGTRHSKELAAFLKAASSFEKYYHINGKQFERQYKDHLSGYRDWVTKEGTHAERYLIFPKNISPRLSFDETSFSDGELYTIVINKDAMEARGRLCQSLPVQRPGTLSRYFGSYHRNFGNRSKK